MEPKSSKYPYADTPAAQMLSDRLAVAAAERWMSTRKLANLLEIKQPSVISHMANGRLAIPVERAVPLAQALRMDERLFLKAVLRQRFPSVEWELLGMDDQSPEDLHSEWLRQLSGVDVANLTSEHARVIGEVARDTKPGERWIAPSEVPHLLRLRELTRKDQFGFNAADWDRYLDGLQP